MSLMWKNCTICVLTNCTNQSNDSNITSVGLERCKEALSEKPFSSTFRVFAIIAIVFMIATAVFGNAVVCYIVYQKPAMRSSINLLLANLAFVDVLIALLCMTASLVTVIGEEWLLGSVLCKVNAFCFSFLVTESTYILLAISWDRYLIIVRREETLTPYKAKVIISITWVISFILSLPPTFGWGRYNYEKGHIVCSLDDDAFSYSLVFYILTIIIPMLIMGYVYYRILCTVRKNSTKVVNHPPVSGVETRVHKRGKMNIDYGFKTRAFLTILILFIGYFFCFLPYLVTRLDLVTGRNLETTSFTQVVLILLCYLNSVLNPMVYYVRIGKFREACRDIVPSCCCLSFLCVPKRPLRRVCPHVIYEVSDRSEKSVSFSLYSMGAFD
ncbi:high-affinity lysophosphatidic acid receptor-like [Dendronephthya gigantea]|uniref:high-affinity lysophosphatidic acid receptor-like n=1 Tax=Dendronephthya gigantea TaxID=151771 RepID=UPI00106C9910|nr:high-affinity lysophosphatidic acid receptor-like [Dendronephthya gigantea]